MEVGPVTRVIEQMENENKNAALKKMSAKIVKPFKSEWIV